MRIAPFAISIVLFSMPAAADVLTGRVVGVSDGDTLTVFDGKAQHRVRLAEIDAPEKNQAFGTVAKSYLSDLCFGGPATVRVETVDRYGRSVGRVTCKGQDANAAMVRAGLAWVYTEYAKDPQLFRLEAEARTAKRQLWRDTRPTPPWQFRQR
jgi:endonuclease YncB( thermonuclease family)